MRKFTIFSCIILFVIASCNNEDEISDSASLNNQDDSTSEIILQERDPNLPKVWSKKIADPVLGHHLPMLLIFLEILMP